MKFPSIKKALVRFRGSLIAAGFILFTLVCVHRWMQPSKPIVQAKPVEKTEIVAEVTGQVRAAKEVFVSIKKGGRLDRVEAVEGDLVEENAILGVLDITDRKAGVQSALSSFSLASQDLARIRSLYRSAAVPRQELDDAVSRYDVRKADLTKARQNLEDGLIRSPIKGKIAVFAFSVGDVLPDGARVAVIEDTSQYFLIGRLSSSESLRSNMPAEIRFRSLDKVGDEQSEMVQGRILPMAPSPTGEVDVRVEFPALPPGLSVREAVRAEVRISTKT